jgi:hypothetical protein
VPIVRLSEHVIREVGFLTQWTDLPSLNHSSMMEYDR